MKKNSLGRKILTGILVGLGAVAVIAAGVKIGNVGYKEYLNGIKDEIKEKLETGNDSTTTPTSASAAMLKSGVEVQFVA